MKERAKEKEKDKKTQQKKKKVNDLGRAGQKSGAPAYANKQVTTENVCLTDQDQRQPPFSVLLSKKPKRLFFIILAEEL